MISWWLPPLFLPDIQPRPLPEDVWPLVYVITAAIVVTFAYGVVLMDWRRHRKLLAVAGFGTVAIVLMYGILYGLVWKATMALSALKATEPVSYQMGLAYAVILTASLVPLGVLALLVTRRRTGKASG